MKKAAKLYAEHPHADLIFEVHGMSKEKRKFEAYSWIVWTRCNGLLTPTARSTLESRKSAKVVAVELRNVRAVNAVGALLEYLHTAAVNFLSLGLVDVIELFIVAVQFNLTRLRWLAKKEFRDRLNANVLQDALRLTDLKDFPLTAPLREEALLFQERMGRGVTTACVVQKRFQRVHALCQILDLSFRPRPNNQTLCLSFD